MPLNSKLFTRLGRDAIDRKKKLFHNSQVRRSGVPADQVEVAWAKEAPYGLDDLADYVPAGHPVTKAEKEFFLDVANTVRGGIHYKPITPLSDGETREIDRLRRDVTAIATTFPRVATQPSVALAGELWGGDWDIDPREFFARQEEAQRQLRQMEAEQ